MGLLPQGAVESQIELYYALLSFQLCRILSFAELYATIDPEQTWWIDIVGAFWIIRSVPLEGDRGFSRREFSRRIPALR